MKIFKENLKFFSIENKFSSNLDKIVIHSGIAKKNKDKNFLKNVFDIIKNISNQKPIFSKIKKSISNFKSKIGELSGIYTTLRKKKMWEFYSKLIQIVIPRIKEFKGLKKSSFDRFGNYNLGINDVNIFPDINSDLKVGLNISFILKNANSNFKEFYKKINFPIE